MDHVRDTQNKKLIFFSFNKPQKQNEDDKKFSS